MAVKIRTQPLKPDHPPADSPEVYYVRAIFPTIHHYTISGPFHVLEAALPNLRQRLSDSSQAMTAFNSATNNGHMLNQFCHVTGPLDADPAQHVMVELLRMDDAQLKRSLPCPVYNVIFSEPILDDSGRPGIAPSGNAALKDMQVIGSYLSVDAAIERANEALNERVSDFPGAQVLPMRAMREEDLYAVGSIMRFPPHATPKLEMAATVCYDSGVMRDPQGNEM
ncbi:hypothetical protein N8I77_009765 [Diaporthe amygdali]|uniref:Uncharacterized protein n=1 Tax=Phomopsis amygdali TaxID=1214568 RepID=A0AAD9SAV1_PHOAM|nr:hypothetical protein N8I77_009765 [Diaporthe amygdali]